MRIYNDNGGEVIITPNYQYKATCTTCGWEFETASRDLAVDAGKFHRDVIWKDLGANHEVTVEEGK
jgi:hypothetical protein